MRSTQQDEIQGGVYLVDLEAQSVKQSIDLSTAGIDKQGRGSDRGLRGIAFDGERVYIAASDELFAFTPDFELIDSWRNPYLKHCHEITVWQRSLFLTSSGFDTILGFDLDKHSFNWAMNIQTRGVKFKAVGFDPLADEGPMLLNKMHLNSVFCNQHGMYISGLESKGMLHFNGTTITMSAEMPPGTYNAQPFRDGVLFNDSAKGVLRYSGRGEGEEDRAFAVPEYDPKKLLHINAEDEKIARPGFARGLCVLSNRLVAGGSSPSTVTLYDLPSNKTLGSIQLSADVRNAIHSLEVWPF
ncbi:MAG: hypothetical protein O7F73_02395 [Gammaproteobacteria bacterium]|nr:hypothetical protein [Gammaproteobacteria bacterium]